MTVPDVRADTILPADIEPNGTGGPDVGVTGAAGFLGSAVVAELLRRGDTTVFCLVRGNQHADPWQRLERALARHGAHTDDPRLRVVEADITLPRCGLAQRNYDELAERLGRVLHCAAQVNVAFPYSALRAANVRGTEEALRLAVHRGTAEFVFASTLGVLFASCYAGMDADESLSAPPNPDGLSGGYTMSKWVSERLAEQAAERAVPVVVHRLGSLAGNQTTGLSNLRDYWWLLLTACARLGCAPALPGAVDWLPVDTAAAGVVAVTKPPYQEHPMVTHLCSGVTLTWQELVRAARQAGIPLRSTGLATWRRRLEALAGSRQDTELLTLAAALPDRQVAPDGPAHISNDDTRRLLAQHGISCGPPSEQTLRHYVRAGLLSDNSNKAAGRDTAR